MKLLKYQPLDLSQPHNRALVEVALAGTNLTPDDVEDVALSEWTLEEGDPVPFCACCKGREHAADKPWARLTWKLRGAQGRRRMTGEDLTAWSLVCQRMMEQDPKTTLADLLRQGIPIGFHVAAMYFRRKNISPDEVLWVEVDETTRQVLGHALRGSAPEEAEGSTPPHESR